MEVLDAPLPEPGPCRFDCFSMSSPCGERFFGVAVEVGTSGEASSSLRFALGLLRLCSPELPHAAIAGDVELVANMVAVDALLPEPGECVLDCSSIKSPCGDRFFGAKVGVATWGEPLEQDKHANNFDYLPV